MAISLFLYGAELIEVYSSCFWGQSVVSLYGYKRVVSSVVDSSDSGRGGWILSGYGFALTFYSKAVMVTVKEVFLSVLNSLTLTQLLTIGAACKLGDQAHICCPVNIYIQSCSYIILIWTSQRKMIWNPFIYIMIRGFHIFLRWEVKSPYVMF